MQYKDYYAVLGVDKKASEAEIKSAYRRLARKYHPDVSKEANAEEQFKNVQEAYEVLKDPEKRKTYDELGSSWQAGQDFRPPPGWGEGAHTFRQSGAGFNGESASFGDFSDFFSSLFGGGGAFQQAHRTERRARRGRDIKASVQVTLKEAFRGAEKMLQLDRHGMSQTIKVKIPPGVISGSELRLAHQGEAGANGAAAGDLYLIIHIEPDTRFSLKERDVFVTVPITPWEAALGAHIEVPTLGGKVGLTLKPGTKSGQKLRLKGRGLPHAAHPGDQYVILEIETPPARTEADKQFYKQMAETMQFNPRDAMEP